MTRVRLITGARSLADDPAAEAWARGLIAAALAGVDLLIVGDAPGPDAWARRTAWVNEAAIFRFVTRGPWAGRIMDRDEIECGSWSGAKPPTGTRGWTPWLLARNGAMVQCARNHTLRGATVSVLALLDGRKATATGRVTRGTEHTARLARAAGLTVDAQTWTPKGATT